MSVKLGIPKGKNLELLYRSALADAGINADSSVLVPYFTEIAKNFELYDDLSQVRKNTIKSNS